MFFKSCYVDAFTVIIFSFIIRIKNLITHLFQKLIYEIQNNLHQLTTHMSTLIMWYNRFSENENEAVEEHIPRHRDSKTKKPRHLETETINHDMGIPRHLFRWQKATTSRFQGWKTMTSIFQGQKATTQLRWNSDPYAPWYPRSVVPALFRRSVGVLCSGIPGFIVCHQSWQSISLTLTHLSENPFLSGFFRL